MNALWHSRIQRVGIKCADFGRKVTLANTQSLGFLGRMRAGTERSAATCKRRQQSIRKGECMKCTEPTSTDRKKSNS